MASRHFGKFADVWKHLVLNEVLAGLGPDRYAETHAGSAAYRLVDDAERRYGVLGYLEAATSQVLSTAPFTEVVSEFAACRPALYPGSALQAMVALGDDSSYLLCDLDPTSAQDLRAWATRLGLSDCDVAERDGMAAVRAWLPDKASTVVHIDPFDPFAHEDGGPSAVELAAEVAEAGHTLVYWYGYSARPNVPGRSTRSAAARASTCGGATSWSPGIDGEVRHDGDLGDATTVGTGCGVVLANVPQAVAARCDMLASELARAYEGRRLPAGDPGRLDLSGSSA